MNKHYIIVPKDTVGISHIDYTTFQSEEVPIPSELFIRGELIANNETHNIFLTTSDNGIKALLKLPKGGDIEVGVLTRIQGGIPQDTQVSSVEPTPPTTPTTPKPKKARTRKPKAKSTVEPTPTIAPPSEPTVKVIEGVQETTPVSTPQPAVSQLPPVPAVGAVPQVGAPQAPQISPFKTHPTGNVNY